MIINQDITIVKHKEIGAAAISIRSDGIMHVDIKLVDEINLDNARAIFELSLEVGEGAPYPNLITFRNKFVLPSKEAREWVAIPERSGRAKAEAYIVHSLAQKLIGDFYIRFNGPVAPTQLFTDVGDGIKWLYKFVD